MFLVTMALCTIMIPTGPGTETPVQGQCKIEVEAETPIEQEVEMAYKQVTAPNTTVQDGAGWCLRHTQSVFASPVAFPSARKAWDGQKGRHTDIPPLGISVPIWFDHYGTYGSPAFWDNWGHVATRLPDGRVLTSPFYSNYGSEIYESIDRMARSMPGGATYLGWSEHMNGKQVVQYERPNKPTPENTTRKSKGVTDMIVIRSKQSGHVFAVAPRYLQHLTRSKSVTLGSKIYNPTQSVYYDYEVADFNEVMKLNGVPLSVVNQAAAGKGGRTWSNGKFENI